MINWHNSTHCNGMFPVLRPTFELQSTFVTRRTPLKMNVITWREFCCLVDGSTLTVIPPEILEGEALGSTPLTKTLGFTFHQSLSFPTESVTLSQRCVGTPLSYLEGFSIKISVEMEFLVGRFQYEPFLLQSPSCGYLTE